MALTAQLSVVFRVISLEVSAPLDLLTCAIVFPTGEELIVARQSATFSIHVRVTASAQTTARQSFASAMLRGEVKSAALLCAQA